jgi:catechol 2,3-dioxygenase-like lactoylglutathione lyase family enzyme
MSRWDRLGRRLDKSAIVARMIVHHADGEVALAMKADPLGPLFQNVTYVVSDAVRTAERFSFLIPGTIFSIERTTLKLADRSEAISLECATAPVGPRREYEIRLLQPLGRDHVFHRFLTEAGPGLHHIAFSVAELEEAAERLAAKSPLLAEMRDDDGRRCIYYRSVELGGIIELNDRPAKNQARNSPKAAELLLASYFTQVAYVVSDVHEARRWVENVLGCEVATPRDVVQGPAWNLKFRGKPAPKDFSLKIAIGKLGPTGEGQIELIEPERGDNVLAEFLNEPGPGLNHIAFMVPDYLAMTAPLRSTGVPPLKEIHVPGMAHSSYFDCTSDGLSTIEVFQTGPHA